MSPVRVYVALSRTDKRRFTSAEPFTDQHATTLKQAGYEIFEVEFELPADWSSVDHQVSAKIQEPA